MTTDKNFAIKNDFGVMEATDTAATTADMTGWNDTVFLNVGNTLYYLGGHDLYNLSFASMDVFESSDGGATWDNRGDTGKISATEFVINAFIYDGNIYAFTTDPANFHIYLRKFDTAAFSWSTIATDPLGAGNVGKGIYDGDFMVFGYVTINASLNITAYSPDAWHSGDHGVNWFIYESNIAPAGYNCRFIKNLPHAYLIGQITNQTSLIKTISETSKSIYYTSDYGDWTTFAYDCEMNLPSDLDWFNVEEITINNINYLAVYGGLLTSGEFNPNIYLWEIEAGVYTDFTSDPIVYSFYRNMPPIRCASIFFYGSWLIASGSKNSQLTVMTNTISTITFKTCSIKLTEQADYETKINDRLLNQYDNSANLKNLIKCYVSDPAQELESLFFSLYHILDIDLEFGKQLDLIGKIVGLPRAGAPDWEYKILLKCQIAAKNSDGTFIHVSRLWRWVTGHDAAYVAFDYPCKVELNVPIFPNDSITTKMIAILEKALPAGVGISGLYINF